MDETVEDRVNDRGFTYDLVLAIDGESAGDAYGTGFVSILDDQADLKIISSQPCHRLKATSSMTSTVPRPHQHPFQKQVFLATILHGTASEANQGLRACPHRPI